MKLPNRFRGRLAGVSRMNVLLLVLVVVGALDLTRRFVTMYLRSQQGETPAVTAVVPPAEPEPQPEPAAPSSPPARTMATLPPPPPPPNPPPPQPIAPIAYQPPQTNAPDNPPTETAGDGGRPRPRGRMQADLLLAPQEIPVTFFAPGAITIIALPIDDDGSVVPVPE